MTGVREVASGRLNHFLSPTGGFHHAKYDCGGGFCIFNDVAAAVLALKDMGFEKVLVADFDVHHGNGTQTHFYEDPDVMIISFHEDPEWMYRDRTHAGNILAEELLQVELNAIPLVLAIPNGGVAVAVTIA